MNVLAIIPARGGSKGIPGKNLAMCGGKPLTWWTINACGDSKHISTSVVSTDDNAGHVQMSLPLNITNLFLKSCVEITDDAQIEDRLAPIIQQYEPDIIVLLQPTSPVRTGKQIDEAIEQLQREGADSLVSVVESHAFLWDEIDGSYGEWNSELNAMDYQHRPRRQDMTPQYEENGSIYVFTREHWERTHNRLGGKISLFIMPEECKLQVDTPFDLWMAGRILERQHTLIAGNNW